MNLTFFGLVNFFLLANLAAISYARKNRPSNLTKMLVGWTDVLVSLSATILQVFIAFLVVKFSEPILVRKDPILKRSVNLMIYYKAGTALEPYKRQLHTRDSENEIEQAFKSY